MVKNTILFAAFFLSSLLCCAQSDTEYKQWISKGSEYYRAKQYKESAEAYSKAFAAFGGKGFTNDRYDAACSWALAGNIDSAFINLERIATKGNFSNYSHLTTDADLSSLRSDKRWQPLCDLVKQNKEKAEANYNKPLAAMLDTIYETDQQYRKQINEVKAKYGQDSKEMKELWANQNYHDSLNQIKVVAIIDQYGWPGTDIVGWRGSQAVWAVIQHADITVQDKYLPIMREAVKNKKASASHLALLEDRVNLRHGRKQVYGSQVESDKDGLFNGELEDPDNVDKRRAEVGLNPLAEYLKYFNVRWDLVEYKKKHPTKG
ncbi:MAG: hypothetical protein K0Q79_248 [Flavipsychrobacter sp.]|jgi:hypothetical protein|nr:hypothetical protein [Flavipsychrobacter sp.]